MSGVRSWCLRGERKHPTFVSQLARNVTGICSETESLGKSNLSFKLLNPFASIHAH